MNPKHTNTILRQNESLSNEDSAFNKKSLGTYTSTTHNDYYAELNTERRKKGLFWETPTEQKIKTGTDQTYDIENTKISVENIIRTFDQKRENQALQADISNGTELPDLPLELAHLPSGLGLLQDYIFSTMTYPCRYTAGWVAITTMTAFVQTNITIQSEKGLGFNEFYLTLAPTGFGKESMRVPLNTLYNKITKENLYLPSLPSIEFSAPSSKQALHKTLQDTPNHSVYIQSDEFAEWLKSTSKDSNKASVLEYLMQIYTKSLSTIYPGRAITTNYVPVHNPKLSIFATTTAESLLTTININYAEMGTYNRWVIYLAPKTVPEKNYNPKNYEPPQTVINFIEYLIGLPSTSISMQNARECYIHYDKNFAEPIRQQDGLLGSRLTEQAIKLAGLFALSHGQVCIEPKDMELGYKIRLGLYHRSKALIDESNTMSHIPEINEAFEQIKKVCIKNETLYISSFSKRSRIVSIR